MKAALIKPVKSHKNTYLALINQVQSLSELENTRYTLGPYLNESAEQTHTPTQFISDNLMRLKFRDSDFFCFVFQVRICDAFLSGNNYHSQHIDRRSSIKKAYENFNERCSYGNGLIGYVYIAISCPMAVLHVYIRKSLQTTVSYWCLLRLECDERGKCYNLSDFFDFFCWYSEFFS